MVATPRSETVLGGGMALIALRSTVGQEDSMLVAMDYAFFIFHTLWIVFNMFGWMSRRTRPAHLAVLGLTILSWFGLGVFYGWGYCLCTDWHFQVRRQLGYPVTESSYIQLLIRQWFGLTINRRSADGMAVVVLLLIVIATVTVWFRPRLQGRRVGT